MVVDVTGRQGLALAAAALQHRSASGRVGLLLNSAAAAGGQPLAPVERLLAGVASGRLEAGASRCGGELGLSGGVAEAEAEAEAGLGLGLGGRCVSMLGWAAAGLPASHPCACDACHLADPIRRPH